MHIRKQLLTIYFFARYGIPTIWKEIKHSTHCAWMAAVLLTITKTTQRRNANATK